MTEADFVLLWARAFAATWVFELAVLMPALRRVEPRPARRATAISLAQLATHPVVWFVLPAFGLPYWAFLLTAEPWAVVVEAVFYRLTFPSLTFRRAALLSLGANAASMLAGLALRAWGLV